MSFLFLNDIVFGDSYDAAEHVPPADGTTLQIGPANEFQ
jgi:hypothetical protein